MEQQHELLSGEKHGGSIGRERALGGWKPYGCIQVALCIFAQKH